MSAELGISAGALLLSVAALVIAEFRSRVGYRLAWNQSVIAWASQAVRRMVEIEHLMGAPRDQVDGELFEARAHLSSLIDEGRFLFENNKSTSWGAEKAPAYRGYRPILLDCLVDAYDFSDPSTGAGTQQEVVACKREFVSQVQSLIDPRWFAKHAAVDTTKTERTS